MTRTCVQYVKLEIRKWALCLKRVLLGAGMLLLLTAVLLTGCYLRLTDRSRPAPIQVALVIPDSQSEIRQLASMLYFVEGVHAAMEFVYPKEDELDSLFEQGKIQAAVLFGEDFYEDVNTGINTPLAVCIRPGVAGVELFQELLSDMLLVVDATQAGSYAMNDTWDETAALSMTDMQDRIMRDNLSLLMQVRSKISIRVLSLTESVELLQYYTALLLLFFLLLPGLSYAGFYDPQDYPVEQRLRIYGVNGALRSGLKIGLMTVIGFSSVLFGVLICLLAGRAFHIPMFTPDGSVIFGLFFLALTLAFFYHGILLLSPGSREKKAIFVSVFLILLLLGGCILPTSCLWEGLHGLASRTPFYLYREYLEAVLFDKKTSYAGLLLWSLFFLFLGEWVYARIGKSSMDAHSSEEAKRHVRRAFFLGGRRENRLRKALYLKWQLQRKSPVILMLSVLILIALLGCIRLPQWKNRTILIGGQEELCRKIAADPRLNQSFQFVYEAEEGKREKAVKGGRVLGAVDFSGQELLFETASVSPAVFVAKETVAAAVYLYRQEELLTEECSSVFPNSDRSAEVVRRYEAYMQRDGLLRVEYRIWQREPSKNEE